MSAFEGGGELITIPAVPSSPASIAITRRHLTANTASLFTGQRAVRDWGAEYLEASVLLPPMPQSQAVAWVEFLHALKGPVNVFQFTDVFCEAYPESLTVNGNTPRLWRLKSGRTGWSVAKTRFYGIGFDCREAISGDETICLITILAP